MSPEGPTITELNDVLRMTFLTGKVIFTEGVACLGETAQQDVITAVQTFTAFTPDNDPYREHDFGAVDVIGVGKVFWKIDYYDRTLTFGNDDPADPAKTCRVLTIMLAEEY